MAHRLIIFTKCIVALALLAVYLPIVSGCAGPGRQLNPPEIGLADISVREIRLFETVFEIELRVVNANDVSLTVKGIDFTFECNGRKIGSGVSDVETIIPARGSAVVPVTVYSSVIDALRGIMGSKDTNELNYRLKGRIHIAGGFLLPPLIPFESEGSISLEETTGPW